MIPRILVPKHQRRVFVPVVQRFDEPQKVFDDEMYVHDPQEVLDVFHCRFVDYVAEHEGEEILNVGYK